MNWLDIVLIVILAIIIFDGWRHGLLHFVSEFIGFGLGILFAVLFHDSLADKLGCISSRGVAEIVAFVIICVVVGVVASVLSHLFLEPRIKRVIPNRVNRFGGMGLGLIIGVALCVFIVLLMDKCITTALDESFFAGLILKCFGSLL